MLDLFVVFFYFFYGVVFCCQCGEDFFLLDFVVFLGQEDDCVYYYCDVVFVLSYEVEVGFY